MSSPNSNGRLNEYDASRTGPSSEWTIEASDSGSVPAVNDITSLSGTSAIRLRMSNVISLYPAGIYGSSPSKLDTQYLITAGSPADSGTSIFKGSGSSRGVPAIPSLYGVIDRSAKRGIDRLVLSSNARLKRLRSNEALKFFESRDFVRDETSTSIVIGSIS